MKRAFTLIELLLVIAIIASLAGIILYALNPAQRLNEANEVKILTNGKDLEKALNAYVLANNGQYPTELQNYFTNGAKTVSICKSGQTCVGADLTTALVGGGYINSIPTNTGYDTTTKTGYDVSLASNAAGPKILGVATTPTFLLRDDFTTTAAAPLTSPRTAEPGPGTLTITDTGNYLSTSGGSLQIANGVDYGDPFLVGSALSRKAGLTVIYRVIPDISLNKPLQVGLIQNTTSTGTSYGYGLIFYNGEIRAGSGISWASVPIVGSYTETITDGAVVLRDAGIFHFVKIGTSWNLLYVNDTAVNATVYPFIKNRTSTNWSVDTLRGIQLEAPFNDDYGLATQRLAGVRSAGETFTHESNAIIEYTLTTLPPSGGVYFDFRKQDNNNYWRVICWDTGWFDLMEYVGGVGTHRGSVGGSCVNGYRIVIVADGNTIRGYTNNTLRWTYASASNFATQTNGSLHTVSSGGVVSDIVIWPRNLTGSAAAALDKAIE